MRKCLVGLFLLLGLFVSGVASAGVLFSDDFSDGLIYDEWEYYHFKNLTSICSSYGTSDDPYVQNSRVFIDTPNCNSTMLATMEDSFGTDYSVEANVIIEASLDDQGRAVRTFIYVNDIEQEGQDLQFSFNGYFFMVTPRDNNWRFIRAYPASTGLSQETIASGTISGISLHTNYIMKIINIGGDKVELYFYPSTLSFESISPVATVDLLDDGLRDGRAGFGGADSIISVSDVVITSGGDDINNALVAYYPFNGNAKDESGNGNDGNVNGATLTADRFDNENSAFNFENDNIVVQDDATLQITNSITLSAWVKLSTSNQSNPILIKENNNYAVILIDGKVMLYARGISFEDTTLPQIYGNIDVNNGQWHHIAATIDSEYATIYVDGQIDVHYTKTGNITNSSGNLEIGSEVSASHYFDGTIDEVRIYNRALSETEITDLIENNQSEVILKTPVPGCNRVYLEWEYEKTDDDIYYKIIFGKNGKVIGEARDEYATTANVTEFTENQAVINRYLDYDCNDSDSYCWFPLTNNKEYEAYVTVYSGESEIICTSNKVKFTPRKKQSIKAFVNSPLLFIPGTGGGAWKDMKDPLDDFGLIGGGELELELSETGTIEAVWEDDTYGDFYFANYNKVGLEDEGQIVPDSGGSDDGLFHPCGPISDNYWATKSFIDAIRSLERDESNDSSARKLTLVGQSLGGLRAREYVQRNSQYRDIITDHDPSHKVQQIITLGTPHNGVLYDHDNFSNPTEEYGVEGAWAILLGDTPYDVIEFFECTDGDSDCFNRDDETLYIYYDWESGDPNDIYTYKYSCGMVNHFSPRNDCANANDEFQYQASIINFLNLCRMPTSFKLFGIKIKSVGLGWDFRQLALTKDVINGSDFLNDINFDNLTGMYQEIPEYITTKSISYWNPGPGNFKTGSGLFINTPEFYNSVLFCDSAYQSDYDSKYMGDGFIYKKSQNLNKIFPYSIRSNSYNIEREGFNHLNEREDIVGLFKALNIPVLEVSGMCPINIEIESPSGEKIAKDHNGILGATYREFDKNLDGEMDKIFEIPLPEEGTYSITVTPTDDAEPGDTYTLEYELNGVTTILANNEPVEETVLETEIDVPPVANAGPDQTVEVADNCLAEVTLDGSNSYEAGSTEGTNDGITSFVWYENDQEIAQGETVTLSLEIGEHEITLVVTDETGNEDEDTVFIEVEDTTSPTVITQDITLSLESTGTVSISANQVDGGSYDECGIASISVTPDTFDCDNVGENTVTLMAFDNNGNYASATATVTIEDQPDSDGDGIGDICDPDDDNDGVMDEDDLCPNTEPGAVVNSSGCSIDDLCPCESDWKNHGAYTKCIAQSAENFVEDGLITEDEKDEIVGEAAESDCGDKEK